MAILATFSAMLFQSSSVSFPGSFLPASVSINEAVELSKKFSDERSYAFVNSVLSKVDRYLGESASEEQK